MNDATLNILADGSKANPHWFAAMLDDASIMAPRRAKYSGDPSASPYTNFILVAFLTNRTVQQVLEFYVAVKQARLMVDAGDFIDERSLDSLADRDNYSILSHGWAKLTDVERREHCLSVLRIRMPEAFE